MKNFLLLTITLVSLSAGKLFAGPGVTATSTATLTLPVNTAIITGSLTGFKASGQAYGTFTYTWTVSPAIAGMTLTSGNASVDGNGNGTIAGPLAVFAPSINTTYTFTLKVNYKKNNNAQSALTATTNVVVNVPLIASAGNAQTLTLSASATTTGTTLSGSATGGSGTYSYSWTKQSGPSGATASASSASPGITGLKQGVFVYLLTINGLATATVQITVLPAPPELVFQNPTLTSGTAGADNAVYKFSNVTNSGTAQVDALVTITGRSSSGVVLAKDASNKFIFDETGTGYDNAFQPRVDYVGSYNSNTDWYMEFQVAFVKAGTSTPVTVNSVGLSGLDIDGNSTFHEYVSFYGLSTYTLEQNTDVTPTSLTSPSGVRFDGSRSEFDGIDVTQTKDEVTANFVNVNAFKIRVGGKVTNGSGNDLAIDNGRQYSLWFKSLSFTTPVETPLPIKLVSFTATKQGSNALLQWTTASELNNEYMEVERSTDGVHFSKVGSVAGHGTTDMQHTYDFSDPLAGLSGIIYYRLRDVDVDGNGTYSKIIAMRLDGSAVSASFSVFPNPFVSGVKLNISSTHEAKAVVTISNIAGQQVATQPVSLQNGQNIIVMQNLSSLKPGVYVVEFTTEEGKFVQKIVKNI